MIKKLFSHPLFSGSMVMFVGSMGVNVVNYVYHVVMGRVLGPESYGVLSSVFALLYIVSIVPLSTSVAIVKFISSAKTHKELINIYIGIKDLIFKIGVALSIILLIASPLIQKFLHIENIFLIMLVSPSLLFSLLALVNQATAQGLMKFFGVIIPNLISGGGKLLIGLILIYLGWGVFGAIFAVVLGVFLAYLYTIFDLKRKLNINKKSKTNFDLKAFFKFALPSLLQALAFTSYFTIDILLVKHFLPEFEVGLYAALSTLGKIVYFAISPIAATMFPIISGRIAKGERYKKIFLASFAATLFVSLSIVVFYYFFPNLSIVLLFGNKYLNASSDLFLMGVFMIFYSVSYLLMNFLLSINLTKQVYLSILIGIIQFILIWFNHSSIKQVIQMNIVVMILLFVGLSVYLLYNHLSNHGKV